jgi:hypothetical protein
MRQILNVIVLVTICGCAGPVTQDDAATIKLVHDLQREAHFSKNPEMLVEMFADDFISVGRGIVDSILVREEDVQRFQDYFSSVEFKKWDDINAPIVRFSDDHSLAYTVVDKMVVLERLDTAGTKIEQSIHYAWTAIYRRQKGNTWKLECITSTNEEPVTKRIDE